jgi:HPt (histidine-containing phosphotransfer) domain-containing protein
MGKQIVYISDEDLKEILPGYLKKRMAEIVLLQQLFANKDYPAIRIIAHNIKGTALSYGLQGAGDIAALLEDSIKNQDYPASFVHFKSLLHYFHNLEVIYT